MLLFLNTYTFLIICTYLEEQNVIIFLQGIFSNQ